MLNSGIIRSFFSANFRYNPPHIVKLSGVMMMQTAVLNAVSATESSLFPFDREVMKFEMFPPGQAATRIMPSAIIGLIHPSNDITSRKVSAGNSRFWQITPKINDFGCLNVSMKDFGLIPNI